MNIKYAIVPLAVTLLAFNCNRHPNNTDEVIETFFNCVKKGDYDKAESLVCQVLNKDPEGANFRLKRLHDLLIKHGIPSKDNWKISYDTTHEILKMKNYAIVIYKEFDQKENRDEGAVMDFTFDYERTHTGDSIMFWNLHSLWKDNN